MKTTVERVQETLRRFEQEGASDADFLRLREFYADMARKGLLVQKKYDLPLVDTIGRTAFQTEK